jgi:hypothetical protein
MLTGGGLLAIGFLVGRFAPARRRFPQPLKPVCGCDHELAYHDPATGTCHGTVKEPTRYDEYGDAIAYKTVQCTCRQYDGPTPLPMMYAPEITE